MNQENASGFGTGLVAGALIGLAIGLLYAPRPGKEVREDIGKAATGLADKARGTCQEIRRAVEETLSKADVQQQTE